MSAEENIFEDVTDGAAENGEKRRSSTVDLSDTSLLVDISDALSEKDKVKFTVHTKTTLTEFQSREFSVVRMHEEFRWLHERYIENPEFAGIIIPPPPPHPDFDASREKLQRLSEGEGTMTKEEFQKMKAELEAEYLATFKKTVAMHEVFLQRLAAHPALRTNYNFVVFLEYKGDLTVRNKNQREKIGTLFQKLTKSADEMFMKNQNIKDPDDFFEQEKVFLVEYYTRIKEATSKSDRLVREQKHVADAHIKISSSLLKLATVDNTELTKVFQETAETFEKLRKFEGRVATDLDLKQSDTLRYYTRDSSAAKDLLYRRLKSLTEFESANKALDRARLKGKNVPQAESEQQSCKEKFEKMSETAKQELQEFNGRRIKHFKRNFLDLTELQLKHAKAQAELLRTSLEALRNL